MPGLAITKLPFGLYCENIETNGQLYLFRTHVTPWKWRPFKTRIYLHVFFRPDADRVFHDHPWSFHTLVLWGGYDELSHRRAGPWVLQRTATEDAPDRPAQIGRAPTGKLVPDRLRWLSWRSRSPEHAHRITRLHTRRVVTLIFRGERGRDWGFWCPPANYRDDTGQVIVSRVNNPTNNWRWVYWRDYLDNHNPEQGEAY